MPRDSLGQRIRNTVGNLGIAAATFTAGSGLAPNTSAGAYGDNHSIRAIDYSKTSVADLIEILQKQLQYRQIKATNDEKEQIAGFIEKMGDNAYYTREKGQRELKKMGYKARPQILKASNHKDVEIASRARYLLGEFAQIDRLRGQHIAGIICELGDRGAQANSAVPILMTALEIPDANTQNNTAEALGKIGSGAKAAIPALVERFNDAKDLETWKIMALALGGIGEDAKEIAPSLLTILRSSPPSSDEAKIAMTALGGIRSEDAVGDLINAIQSATGTHTKVIAVEALGNIGRPQKKVLAAIADCCMDSTLNARKAAIEALNKREYESQYMVPQLIRIIKEGSCLDATTASIKKLTTIGEDAKAAIPALTEIAEAEQSEEAIKRWGEYVTKSISDKAEAAIEAIEGKPKEKSK